MKKLFLAIILLATLSCASKQPSLGHWHIHPIDDNKQQNTQEYFTIDVLNDTLAILNKDVYLHTGGLEGFFDQKKQLFGFPGECFSNHFRYKVDGERLLLNQEAYDEKNDVKYIGVLCGENCCDKQEEYFIESNLTIDLPLAIDTSGLIKMPPHIAQFQTKLLFGHLKEQHPQNNDHAAFQFELDGQLVEMAEIAQREEWIVLTFPEAYRHRVIHVIYSDHKMPLAKLTPVLQKYQELGKTRMYLALREVVKSAPLQLWYQKVDLSQLDQLDDHQDLTLGDWLELAQGN